MRIPFTFEPAPRQAVGSLLYQEHIKQAASCPMAEFAGYIMPLWFSSITQEHRAVRQQAGLFDCTHMGVLGVRGPDAAAFLEVAATNRIADMEVGQARYCFLLDAGGHILDDLIVYRRRPDYFVLVVNAINEAKVKAYLEGLAQDRWIIDDTRPDRGIPWRPSIEDLRDPALGHEGLVDIAVQGPRSLEVLEGLVDTGSLFLAQLRPFRFIECSIQKIPCMIARTGYTGARVGFEVFVQPGLVSQLWNMLLQKGVASGLVPCGLGARDSLRIEAGLPLYGHELAGPFDIDPFEAGYGWAVSCQKEFFVGKAAMLDAAGRQQMGVARLVFPGGKGVRPVRTNDAVLDSDRRCIGWALSTASVGSDQIVLAYIESRYCEPATPLGLYYRARSQPQIKEGRRQSVERADQVECDLAGKVLPRFAKF